MVELLNALGFFQKGGVIYVLGTSKKVIIEQAGLSNITEQDRTIKDISRSIYVQKASKNPYLICAITVNTGGVTKGFTTNGPTGKTYPW